MKKFVAAAIIFAATACASAAFAALQEDGYWRVDNGVLTIEHADALKADSPHFWGRSDGGFDGDVTELIVAAADASVPAGMFSGTKDNPNTSLTRVEFVKDSSSVIEGGAFAYCAELVSADLSGVVTIEDGTGESVPGAFQGCKKLVRAGANHVSSNSGNVIPDEWDLSSSIVKIGAYAFAETGLTDTMSIAYTTGTIGSRAFYGCKGLNTVSLSDGATITLGDEAFSECSPELIVVARGNLKVANAGDQPFRGLELMTVSFRSHINNIGDSVQTVFGNSIKFVQIQSRGTPPITLVPEGAFDGITSIGTLWIHDSITEIGANAFRNCSGIESMSFDGITPPKMAGNAFIGVGVDNEVSFNFAEGADEKAWKDALSDAGLGKASDVSDPPSGGNKSSSGGGCDSGLGMAAMLALTAFEIFRKR